MRKNVLILLLSACCWLPGHSQHVRDIIIDESSNGKIFSEFLLELEEKHAVDFIFDEEEIQALTVTGVSGRTRLMDYLDSYLVHFRVTKVEDNIIFIVDRTVGNEYGRRKDNYVVLKEPQNGEQVTLEGIVTDGGTNEPIVGAQVLIPSLNKGTLTNVNGHFTLQVSPSIQHLEIQYVGFEPTPYILGFSPYGSDRSIDAAIFPESRELESVIVTAERIDQNVTDELTGIERLSIETIRSLPTFLGEVDPVRSLTTLPGVSTAGEMSSGYNVRGGEAGQNLILQDGAPIYNPSHLFGFFSAFNPDMVNNVSLYKGGGPASFGSRISSVLDIELKNGDAGKHTISGGAGLISSRLSVEGPIVRDKSSYLLGGRISYSNWLVNVTNNKELDNSSARFYDITGKVFQTINQHNFISLSVYKSYDDFKLDTDSTFSWGTLNTSLKWDHTFSDLTSSTLTVFNSRYFSEVTSHNEIEAFTYMNAIDNIGLKYELNYEPGENLTLAGGLEATGSLLEPGKITPGDAESIATPEDLNDQRALETALYLQGDYKLAEKWSVSAGMRYSYFLRLGKDGIYTFDYSDMNGRYPAIEDTILYGTGEIIERYGGPEPRISVRYLVKENTSIKASYYRVYQYLHLISNTTATTPQDYWIASGPYLKPEIGSQFSLGYFRNFKNNRYEFSLEGFYKEISNAVDYIEGADITMNPALEAGLAQGKGMAYGVELLIKKNGGGRVNGWLAYTFSRSLRKFDTENEYKVINDGDWYPSFYDKPHDISLIVNYRLGKQATLSANFNYSTGRPITIPISKYSYDAYLAILNYSQRNEYRIPDYHRLDLSLTIKDKPRKNRRFMGEWIISVFNLYGRKNAYAITFNRYGTAEKLSILGSVFPSISYNFKF